MSILGANPEQMQQLAVRFRNEARAVSDLQGRITGTLADTVWTGPAAERFRSEWETSFRQALTRLEAALDDNAQQVERRLQAITEATS